MSKYVAALETDADGRVKATIRNIAATIVDGKFVTLVPMISGTTEASSANDMGKGLYGWVCGHAAGTTLDKKYLPGSCRGTI